MRWVALYMLILASVDRTPLTPPRQSDLKVDDGTGKVYIRYTHDGPLAEFSRCETTDRDNVWSISEGNVSHMDTDNCWTWNDGFFFERWKSSFAGTLLLNYHSSGENGKSRQTTIMVVNNLMVTESHDGETATFHPAFFSTTFQLTLVTWNYTFKQLPTICESG